MARQQGVDLIVIGGHGRHGLALLHGAPCDVLAVRIRD
jgi:universal stress protein A